MQWHSIVAPLVDAVHQEAGKVTLRADAVARVQTLAQALDAGGRREVAMHVVAFAKMLWSGRATLQVEPALGQLADLAVVLLGDAARAADAFASAGIESAALLGATREVRAPRAEDKKPTGPPVKAARGLKKN